MSKLLLSGFKQGDFQAFYTPEKKGLHLLPPIIALMLADAVGIRLGSIPFGFNKGKKNDRP
ncbi:MAG: hypothetical protein AB1344_06850 [Pseudomonadota bacterium]